jgi:flagellar biosynthesis protein FliR
MDSAWDPRVVGDVLASVAPVPALVLARSLGLAWTAPVLAAPGLDPRFRLGLAALLTAVLVPVAGPLIAPPGDWAAVGWACLAEGLIGAGLGWSAALIVAGARQAGELVAAQAGLSAAALVDPDAGDDLSALGQLYGLVALAVFLALDGPLALVRALVESYRVLPAGGGGIGLSPATARLALDRIAQALELAVRAAAPPALALALAGVALGLLGRAAPSLAAVAGALPVRSALGLVLVLFGLATLAATLAAAWGAPAWE